MILIKFYSTSIEKLKILKTYDNKANFLRTYDMEFVEKLFNNNDYPCSMPERINAISEEMEK